MKKLSKEKIEELVASCADGELYDLVMGHIEALEEEISEYEAERMCQCVSGIHTCKRCLP